MPTDSSSLSAIGVDVSFDSPAGAVHALRGASIELERGTTLALVGESGSGKSTLGRVLLGLEPPSAGEVLRDGQPIYRRRRPNPGVDRRVQAVFQSPASSLDPRKTVGNQLARFVRLAGADGRADARARAHELLEDVGLTPSASFFDRLPHELSGGQQQRVAIARAVAFRPEYLVADEPTSALDVSVRVQILKLLKRMQVDHDVGILFVTHDLATVRSIADRVAVLYLGEIVESGDTDSVFDRPEHPYTRALMASSPTLTPQQRRRDYLLVGEPPSATDVPSGCALHPRCPVAEDRCRVEAPALATTEAGGTALCHFVGRFADADRRPNAAATDTFDDPVKVDDQPPQHREATSPAARTNETHER